ncbi:related to benomyl/methotrexate resistance protein [Cephalotrichum gorgonifer]|uniref:Related to benomyl/methotrexate resistance protein n=1 Tax=Cephalotrichum gorgonifer TaxID=2041049 RepID=A0AAE8N2I2_9PEZI|nr:related to benomyl/methotrexate resistance protein [Cephalotrichum gorgonifer]
MDSDEEKRHPHNPLPPSTPARRSSSPAPIPSSPSSTSSTSTDRDSTTSRRRPASLVAPSLHEDAYPYEVISRVITGESSPEAEAAREALTYTRTATSVGSAASRPADFEVTFEPNDPEDPRNWPLWYRAYSLVILSYSCWVVVLYSTSYTSTIPGLIVEFGVSSPVATLGLTTYLLGLATGSLIAAPLSELYGRHRIYLISMTVSTILIIPSGLATSLTQMIVVRYFGALFAASYVANSPGSIVDVTTDEYRALAMSLWSIAPLNGPVTGPMIGGFVFQYLGWRWNNWIVMILAGAAILGMAFCRETYAPEILRRKAARLRKETDDDRWWSRYDQRQSKWQLLLQNMSRPFVMSFTEPILWFFNAWISLVYGILYLCFVAYPIVFSQGRGWGPGISGLAFVGIGIGTVLTIIGEPVFRRIINSRPRDPETGAVLPEASAVVLIIGAVLTPIGQLGFSWTCLPTSIHWAVPIAFGIPFGMGNSLCFIYGSNYLATSYSIYAASALAGNTVVRSIFGAVLPLAGPSMYEKMTPQWAGTLLGLLELAMVPIPVIFWKYGERIRQRSPVITQMREEKERAERKKERHLARMRRRAEREAMGGKRVAVDEDVPAEDDSHIGRESVERDVEKEAGRGVSDGIEKS